MTTTNDQIEKGDLVFYAGRIYEVTYAGSSTQVNPQIGLHRIPNTFEGPDKASPLKSKVSLFKKHADWLADKREHVLSVCKPERERDAMKYKALKVYVENAGENEIDTIIQMLE